VRIMHAIQELATGGAERVVVSLTNGAKRAGHEVAIAAAPGPLGAEVEVPLFPLPIVRRRPAAAARAAWTLHAASRAWGPDLVHCHNPGMAVVASLATLRGRRRPGLVSVQGVPEEDYPATARTLRLAGLPIVACGPGVADVLAEHGVEVEATIVNSVGPAPPPANREQLAREWGFSPEMPLVVNVGRLVPQKNQALAIRAISEVPGAVLAVIGDGPLRGELEREIRQAGVSGRVVLAGARQDARAVMDAADAVVSSSRWEGLPLAGLEALAAGTPLVATAVRGVRELIVDGETGLLVEPDDAGALAAALRRVLGDAELAHRLGERGRRLAANYGEEKMIAAFLELYETLVRGKTTRDD
jgi:glycosyltransferase involved in cell wall biosynthesis